MNKSCVLFSWYVGTILLSNVSIVMFGAVPVGFGLQAPAGVFFAGASFTLRDILQESSGRRLVIVAVWTGAVLSAILSPDVAMASGGSFMVSELMDWAIYERLRRHGFYIAVLASNLAGSIVDSALFLWLAFGSIEMIGGLILGKTLATVGFLAVRMLRCGSIRG